MSAHTTTEICIERGIPMPGPDYHAKAASKFPFGDMQIGDSFFASAAGSKNVTTLRAQIHNAATYYRTAKVPGFKIATRREGDGYRAWRIA